jgi:hypothetical protein
MVGFVFGPHRALATLATAALLCALASASEAAAPRLVIGPAGIGGDRFGLAKAKTIRELTAVLGRPSAHFVNSGCGARFSETAWGHLYVEFRDGRFSGFRYIENGWPPTRYGTKPRPSVLPRLATSRGITLGSTLGQVRRAYGRLDLVGTDRWMVRRGLIFCDDSKTEPPAASSRIIEIKIGTCGDF